MSKAGEPVAMEEGRTLLAIGSQHLDAENTAEALLVANEAQGKFKAAGDTAGQADALRLAIHCFRAQEKRNFAVQLGNEELKRFEAENDKQGEAKMKLALSEVYFEKMGSVKNSQALQLAEEALQTFTALDDIKMQAHALLALSTAHLSARSSGKKEEALLAQQAASNAGDMFGKLEDKRGQAKSCHNIGVALHALNEFEDAQDSVREALALFHDLGDFGQEAFEMRTLAQWNLAGENPGDALPIATEALALLRSNEGNAVSEAHAASLVIRAHMVWGNEQRAMQVARNALQRFHVYGDQLAPGYVLDAMVHALQMSGNLKGSLQAANRALTVFRDEQEKRMVLSVMRTTAGILMQAQRDDDALTMAIDAVKAARELDDNMEVEKSYVKLAEVYMGSADGHDTALRAAEEARALCQQQGDLAEQASVVLLISSIYRQMGQVDDAGSMANEAFELFVNAGDDAGEARALLSLAEIQLARGDFEKSVSASDKARELYFDLRDRLGQVSALLLQSHALNRATTMIAEMELIPENGDGALQEPSALDEMRHAAVAASGEAVYLCREFDSPAILTRALTTHAEAEVLRGWGDRALKHAEEAVEVARQLGDYASEAEALNLTAQVLNLLGRKAEAPQPARAALEIYQWLEDEQGEKFTRELLQQVAPAQKKEEAVEEQVVEVKKQEAAPEKKKKKKNNTGVREKMDPTAVLTLDLVKARIQSVFQEFDLEEEVECDTGLMAAGLTSQQQIAMGQYLQSDFPTVSLPGMLGFDYPTVNGMAGYMMEQINK